VLWAGSKLLDVYLGTRAVAICDDMEVLLAEPVQGFEAGLSSTQQRLVEYSKKLRVRVWLSGGLCRPFLLPTLPGIHGANETLRVATKLANERTGLAGACQVWLETNMRSESRVAVAVARVTLNRLQVGLGNRCRIDSVRPWWSDVLRTTLQQEVPPRALGVRDCDSLTVLLGRNGGFEVATTVTPVVDDASADAVFARALLSADSVPGRQALGRMVLAGNRRLSAPSGAFRSLLEIAG
jgi:hypothetical protein